MWGKKYHVVRDCFYIPRALPVSLMLLRRAANPLRIPLLPPLAGDCGETVCCATSAGGDIIAFFLAALTMSLYVTGVCGVLGCSETVLVAGGEDELVERFSCERVAPAENECLVGTTKGSRGDTSGCGERLLLRNGRLLFLTRLRVLDTPLNICVGVFGGFVAVSVFSAFFCISSE